VSMELEDQCGSGQCAVATRAGRARRAHCGRVLAAHIDVDFPVVPIRLGAKYAGDTEKGIAVASRVPHKRGEPRKRKLLA
jgi:hypothetical protein